MNRLETKQLLDKIQAFRQSFNITNSLLDEWYKILEPYRYQDVNKKLDEYFRESSNFGQYPDAYSLVRYLRTEEELQHTSSIQVRCSMCGRLMNYNDLEEHFDRCSSVSYIYINAPKYLNRTFDKSKLWEMDKSTFDKFYIKFCEEIFKKMPDCLQRHLLENTILTYYGKEPKHNLDVKEAI